MALLPVILGLVFAILAAGAALAFMNGNEAKRRKNLQNKIRGGASEKSASSAKNLQDKRRAEIAKKLRSEKEEALAAKKKTTLNMMIEQAGLKISVKQFWLFSLVSMLVLVVLAKMMGQPAHILILAAIIGLLGVPRFVLKKKAANRQKKFLEEFPDALEATVRLLKAGMPVSEAISMISREFSGPVGEEMTIIYNKQKIGIPLHEAALEATRRIPLTEMQMFATGLSIQAQTGSSLSEVLMNLSGVIRARFRLKRKIKALSSEAVASACIIGARPILVATGMYFTNYDYISVLFTTKIGNFWLIAAVTWMSMGIFVMKTMINFKI